MDYPIIVAGREIFTEKKQTVFDKYSREAIASVSIAGEKEVEEALDKAYKTRKTLAEIPAHKRAEFIFKAVDIIKSKREYIGKLIAREAGKPIKYALGEVDRCIENLTYAGEEAKRIHGETFPVDASKAGENRYGFFERFPIGVVVAISPFNFPLNLAAHKVGPAIAAGCPVILKPAGLTPLSGIELIKAFVEASVPEGSVSVLAGSGSTVGEMLIRDKRVSKISFTGSREVGEHITKTAGLKKVTMELGSNSAVVVDNEIYDIDYAVKRCVLGAYYNQGQVCISVQRIYVHKDIFKDFLVKFVEETRKQVIGNPLDEKTDVGPMISEAEAIRVESWINEAKENGAEILTGGKRDGVIYLPTVITNANDSMRIVKDELFAPAVVIMPVDSFEEGVERADNSEYGLQAGVFTKNVNRAMYAFKNINVGGVMINDIPSFRVDHMPYGGNKGSGLGREGARFAIEDMTVLKAAIFNFNG
ncbi:aldehyde dehydrogenase [Thermotomaculum hydrothermale]|uniref:Aldehyde dehydrogenase n=1 Tax=Thermotomaculum hydrothermale TaxID=981385 RepID=A0A7R6PEA7_9BACT|nr:aldehyde dehydrogenase family protein [Thermotomaculum hydrothermale]BBB32118.1 aldehyde dehydrogenase [Thermotomaculum hydrothermale]